MYEPWEGSELSIESAIDIGGTASAPPDMFVVIFLIVTGLMFLLLFTRLVTAISAATTLATSAKRAKDVLNDNYACDSVLIFFYLSIPLYSLIFLEEGLTQMNYWPVFLTMAAFFVFRYLAFFCFGWLGTCRDEVEALKKTSRGVWILIMMFSCLIMLVSLVLPQVKGLPALIYLFAVAAAGLILYAIRGYRIIISSGFSGFFWILYLCSLEVLPLCVAVKVVVS